MSTDKFPSQPEIPEEYSIDNNGLRYSLLTPNVVRVYRDGVEYLKFSYGMRFPIRGEHKDTFLHIYNEVKVDLENGELVIQFPNISYEKNVDYYTNLCFILSCLQSYLETYCRNGKYTLHSFQPESIANLEHKLQLNGLVFSYLATPSQLVSFQIYISSEDSLVMRLLEDKSDSINPADHVIFFIAAISELTEFFNEERIRASVEV